MTNKFCTTCYKDDEGSDELIEKLGDDFYELKLLVSGGFCAYSTEDRAVGQTAKESLENLLKLVNDRKTKGEVA